MGELRRVLKGLLPLNGLKRIALSLRDFDRTPPILVFQMGKVGSTAVYRSLRTAAQGAPVYHAHFLSYRGLDEVEGFYRAKGATRLVDELHYWRAIRRKLDRSKRRAWVISMVRDPVARDISDVFQNMPIHHASLLVPGGEVQIRKTLDALAENFSAFDESSDYACTWFDREMKEVFGIDVFATPFDRARGYSILENERARLLLLRMEDMDDIFCDAMQAFMGLSVQLGRFNDASDKGYHAAYKAVTGQVRLPRTVAEKIYASRYARHFYSDTMIEAFLNKWTGIPSASVGRGDTHDMEVA
ncbi:MAG: putative capsular polysaccharide synthesis family protein [Gammaproteobacteria bacterium]|nr:putative capsular polysaccharide synthesis family protein [Gammaproteobacteria bacterium]MBU1624036.1 putative capsular polysaccharide synthesis family protein [Gammaproteobacteria bacterium]MBU1981764.1 putative capsular polysaccharide synthesis family protein [Gammaproteobacteria bacterium]